MLEMSLWLSVAGERSAHGAMGCRIDPSLNYFRFSHNLCNKGRGVCYPVCGMVHINKPLLLTRIEFRPTHNDQWEAYTPGYTIPL